MCIRFDIQYGIYALCYSCEIFHIKYNIMCMCITYDIHYMIHAIYVTPRICHTEYMEASLTKDALVGLF